MGRARFLVRRAGAHASVQDAGRFGAMRYGVPESGPMDRAAFAAANAAIGNAPGAAVLETSLGALELECLEGPVTVAVAGGGFQVQLDEAVFGAWAVRTVSAGSRLSVRAGLWGSWTYLAFAGRLKAKAWLGSVATHGPSGLGGGRLAQGQVLEIEQAEARQDSVGDFPCPVFARPRHTVRAVLGPQERYFAAATLDAFLGQAFVLTDAYDRMGVRLAGPRLAIEGALDMPSEAIVRGSVQVSGDGVATVLLADHQTTGGYPKIATILSSDLDGFVQLRRRDAVQFKAVTPEEAVEAARTEARARMRFLALLREGRPTGVS